MSNTDKIKQLNLLFGSYRAEWLKGRIYDFFAEPSYFLALQDNRPFVLEGGRGTGKTTVLRGLSYEGQYALHDKDIDKFDSESKFVGIYHRVDTNHVRAFTDGGLSDKKWIKIFAHYFNLIICRDILLFIKWHNKIKPHDLLFTSHQCKLIAQSLHIKNSIEDFTSLVEALDIAMYAFQASINNIGDDTIPLLSMAGDPIKLVTSFAATLPQFTDKMFFILLDEYENYTDYQQQVINTLIKHSTNDYTFKIGVRELGWRIKHTLNKFEMLHDPADYVRINIENKLTEESHFSEFAKNVCQQRLELLSDTEGKDVFSIENSLANLTIEEEAEVLGITNTLYWNEIQLLPQEKLDQIKGLSKLYKFFLAYWSKIHNNSLIDAIDDYSNNSNIWDTRYENYKYDLLFKIKKGR
ncbi:MAG: hypothetical protein KAS17_08935, partial [Victivallaceae bacterium]|nr:hypothetical protein [Victivallaceae bacterium]